MYEWMYVRTYILCSWIFVIESKFLITSTTLSLFGSVTCYKRKKKTKTEIHIYFCIRYNLKRKKTFDIDKKFAQQIGWYIFYSQLTISHLPYVPLDTDSFYFQLVYAWMSPGKFHSLQTFFRILSMKNCHFFFPLDWKSLDPRPKLAWLLYLEGKSGLGK